MTDKPSKEELSDLITKDTEATVAEDITAAIEEAEADAAAAETEEAKANGKDTDAAPDKGEGDAAPVGEEEAKKAAPEGDGGAETEGDKASAAEAGGAPEHWSSEDKEVFNSQTPEAQTWMIEKSKSLEAGYAEKFKEVAGLKKAIDPWGGYLQQIGATPELAIQYLIGAEYQLRTGTPAVKREALLKIAKDYDIDLEQAEGGEGEEDFTDPAVKALQEEVTKLGGLVTSQQHAQTQGQQNVAESEIQAFAEEKTEAGQPAHPHFNEVLEDLVMQARVEAAQGRKPNLKDLYDRAIWSNPAVRAKLVSAEKETDAKKRAGAAKEKEQKARQAASSVSGAPAGAGQPEAKQNLREEITEAMNTAS